MWDRIDVIDGDITTLAVSALLMRLTLRCLVGAGLTVRSIVLLVLSFLQNAERSMDAMLVRPRLPKGISCLRIGLFIRWVRAMKMAYIMRI